MHIAFCNEAAKIKQRRKRGTKKNFVYFFREWRACASQRRFEEPSHTIWKMQRNGNEFKTNEQTVRR